MSNIYNDFKSSISAGVLISLATYISLSCNNPYISAILFCIGLYTICLYNLNLFTGIIGYLPQNANKDFLIKICSTLIGNFIGCAIMSWIPLPESVHIKVIEIISQKQLNQSIINSMLCGAMVLIAVDIYKTKQNILGILLCIPGFILSKMEHSIVNMYYLWVTKDINFSIFIFNYIVGNAFGAMIMRYLLYPIKKLDHNS